MLSSLFPRESVYAKLDGGNDADSGDAATVFDEAVERHDNDKELLPDPFDVRRPQQVASSSASKTHIQDPFKREDDEAEDEEEEQEVVANNDHPRRHATLTQESPLPRDVVTDKPQHREPPMSLCVQSPI